MPKHLPTQSDLTASSTSDARPSDPIVAGPSALSATDVDRVAAVLAAARAPATRWVYTCAWGLWERWCQARGLDALPGDPTAFCAYLTERAAEGIAVASLGVTCSAVRHVHRSHGLPDPTSAEIVRQVRSGLRRTYGISPRRQACPLDLGDLRAIVTGIDRHTAKGARDAALILVGFASAMRRSELVALDLVDITIKPAGLVLTVRRSKTDQAGEGAMVAVSHGRHADTDPVATWRAWHRRRGTAPGPAFTRIRADAATLEPISVDRYIRPLQILATTSSRDLGL